jgi:hypothetical protein
MGSWFSTELPKITKLNLRRTRGKHTTTSYKSFHNLGVNRRSSRKHQIPVTSSNYKGFIPTTLNTTYPWIRK